MESFDAEFDKHVLKKLIKWFKSVGIYTSNDPTEIIKTEKLDLRMKNLSKIPSELRLLRNLKELDLSYNKLSSLPPQLKALEKLEVLRLERNDFVLIPNVIFELKNLKLLDFESNKITALPPEIGNLINLEHLNIFYNKLTKIPDEIGKLLKLNELNLSANSLSELPDSIGNLKELRELYLWSNKITELPDCIKNLPNLKDVDLFLNQTKLNHKLIEAIQKDDVNLATEMISHGADTNYKWMDYGNLEFTNPLFEAKSAAMVKLLIENEADPNVKREIVKATSIKVWESDKQSGNYETFLTKKHSVDIVKYLKKKKLRR